MWGLSDAFQGLCQRFRGVVRKKNAADTVFYQFRQGAPAAADADQAAGHSLHHGDAEALGTVRDMDKYVRTGQQLRHICPGAQKFHLVRDAQFPGKGFQRFPIGAVTHHDEPVCRTGQLTQCPKRGLHTLFLDQPTHINDPQRTLRAAFRRMEPLQNGPVVNDRNMVLRYAQIVYQTVPHRVGNGDGFVGRSERIAEDSFFHRQTGFFTGAAEEMGIGMGVAEHPDRPVAALCQKGGETEQGGLVVDDHCLHPFLPAYFQNPAAYPQRALPGLAHPEYLTAVSFHLIRRRAAFPCEGKQVLMPGVVYIIPEQTLNAACLPGYQQMYNFHLLFTSLKSHSPQYMVQNPH